MPSPATEYLRELIGRFPQAGAMTLAKKAYTAHPELWASLDSCRSAIRKILGTKGRDSRQECDPTHYREPRSPSVSPWADVIPKPLTHFDGWRAVQFDGPIRALILSDVHIPYHDEISLGLALDHGLVCKANFVLLNGDIADHYGVSHWEKDPRKRNFAGELSDLRHFLRGLRKRFPRARIVYKLGNHEERYERYMRLKAPELLDVPDFDWPKLVGLEALRIELVKDRRPIRLGSLNVIHGHEYRFQISNPVNPARGMFLRAKTHVLGGHFHQTSQHSERNLEQKTVSTWSTGCLCDLHPEYAVLNNWNHGFAFVDIDRDGSFGVENLRVIDGKVW